MSSKGGRPRKFDIRPGMEVAGGWKILDMDRTGIGDCTLECPKCYSRQIRSYSQIGKVLRNVVVGFKCTVCTYSTSEGHRPKYNIVIGEMVAGWLVTGIGRNKERHCREYHIQCPNCSHIESRDSGHFYEVIKQRSSGFKCSQCAHSTARHRGRVGFNVGDSIWNFTVLSIPDDKSKGSLAKVAIECKQCKHQAQLTRKETVRRLQWRRYFTCPVCEAEQLKGLEIAEWKIVGKASSGHTKSAWTAVHTCGKERRVLQSEIDKARAGNLVISCGRCKQREDRRQARELEPPKIRLTPWQQKYFAAAMSSRKRTILGTPVQNSIVDLRTEAIETMQMCSRWDDNRCKYEIALLNPRKFEIELRTSFQQYNAGSARI